jgi:hypothetical protein
MADPFHPDIDAVCAIPQGALEFRPHPLQGRGLQTLHLAAAMALEVRVGRVVLAGQFVMGHPVLQGQSAEKAPAGEIIQNAVNADFIHPPLRPDRVQNFLSAQGPGRGPESLQYRQAQGSGLYAIIRQ